MKKILSSAFAILLLVGAAQAQVKTQGAKDSTRMHRKHDGQKQQHINNLTEAQKAELKKLHAQQKAEMEALKANTALTTEQRQLRRKEIQQKYHTQMQALLTPEQRAAAAQRGQGKKEGHYKDHKGKMKMERKADGPARDTIRARGNRPDGDRAQRMDRAGRDNAKEMAAELNLTEAQKAKMQQLRSETRTKMEAVRNDASLTQEQKRQKQQELMMAQKEQMKTVLTKEQLEKFQSMNKGRGDKPRKAARK